MITLRPHQVEAVDALFAYFDKRAGHPLVVLPTASGKSYVIAAFCERALEEHPGTRILVATHRAARARSRPIGQRRTSAYEKVKA